MSDDLYLMVVMLCGFCRAGAGGECHTPGCAFYMNRAPDVPLTAALSRDEMIEAAADATCWLGRDDAEVVLRAAGVIAAEAPT